MLIWEAIIQIWIINSYYKKIFLKNKSKSISVIAADLRIVLNRGDLELNKRPKIWCLTSSTDDE